MPPSEMFKFFGGRVAASPQMCRAILRLLAANGPLPTGDLAAALQPVTLTDPLEAQYQTSLEIVRELELVVGRDTFEISDQYVGAGGTLAEFRIAFRRALVLRALHEIDSGGEPSDLFQGLLWLSMQPHTSSWSATSDQDVIKPLNDFGFRGVIANSEQWRGFRDWSRALGFIRELPGTRLVPDAVPALTDSLVELSGEFAMRAFMDSVARSFPLLHGASVRTWFSGKQPNMDLDRPSQVLSWAMARLQRSGRLECTSRDDAVDQWTMAAPVGRVSHVKVMA